MDMWQVNHRGHLRRKGGISPKKAQVAGSVEHMQVMRVEATGSRSSGRYESSVESPAKRWVRTGLGLTGLI